MSVWRRFVRRITNRDMLERSEAQKDAPREETNEGRAEYLEVIERTGKANATRLQREGFPERAEAERRRVAEAKVRALSIGHREVYGDDPLLDLLGGPGAPD